VTHARFVGADQSSDGVVLLRIIQVLKTLILSPEGIALTNESVCEIIMSCFRICFETRLNELLRRTAEHALRDMILLLFMRLPQFVEDEQTFNIKALKVRPEDTTKKTKSRSSEDSSSEIEVLDQKSEVSENPDNVQETNEEQVIESEKIEESVPEIETVVVEEPEISST
jgi:brefeldin A-resistance guanine nucleotide exchange factor 1